jgi:hypothetical protein
MKVEREREVTRMSIELLLLVLVLWLLAGIVDAWVLHRRRDVGWPWLALCVLTGPLSVAVVFDQLYWLESEPAATATDRASADDETAADVDGICPLDDLPVEWPNDDPEGRLLPQGFRKLSDE